MKKVECRTPASGKPGVTRIPAWKYEALRTAILEVAQDAGPKGFLFSELKEAVKERLSADDLDALGSLGWHTTTVKLNMEVVGDIMRLPGNGPQRIAVCT